MTNIVQETLFEVGPASVGEVRVSRSHAEMLQVHGVDPGGRRCGECRELIRQGLHDRNYFKCRRTVITRGAASDWRLKWPACGVFEALFVGAEDAGRSVRACEAGSDPSGPGGSASTAKPGGGGAESDGRGSSPSRRRCRPPARAVSEVGT